MSDENKKVNTEDDITETSDDSRLYRTIVVLSAIAKFKQNANQGTLVFRSFQELLTIGELDADKGWNINMRKHLLEELSIYFDVQQFPGSQKIQLTLKNVIDYTNVSYEYATRCEMLFASSATLFDVASKKYSGCFTSSQVQQILGICANSAEYYKDRVFNNIYISVWHSLTERQYTAWRNYILYDTTDECTDYIVKQIRELIDEEANAAQMIIDSTSSSYNWVYRQQLVCLRDMERLTNHQLLRFRTARYAFAAPTKPMCSLFEHLAMYWREKATQISKAMYNIMQASKNTSSSLCIRHAYAFVTKRLEIPNSMYSFCDQLENVSFVPCRYINGKLVECDGISNSSDSLVCKGWELYRQHYIIRTALMTGMPIYDKYMYDVSISSEAFSVDEINTVIRHKLVSTPISELSSEAASYRKIHRKSMSYYTDAGFDQQWFDNICEWLGSRSDITELINKEIRSLYFEDSFAKKSLIQFGFYAKVNGCIEVVPISKIHSVYCTWLDESMYTVLSLLRPNTNQSQIARKLSDYISATSKTSDDIKTLWDDLNALGESFFVGDEIDTLDLSQFIASSEAEDIDAMDSTPAAFTPEERTEKHSYDRLIAQYSLEGELLQVYEHYQDIQHSSKVVSRIFDCLNGKYDWIGRHARTAAGYQWKYVIRGQIPDKIQPTSRDFDDEYGYLYAQYSPEGELLKVYDSSHEACAAIGEKNMRKINQCIRGQCNTVGGFQWRKVTKECIPEKVEAVVVVDRNQTPIAQYDLEGNFIKVYPSIKDVCEEFGNGSVAFLTEYLKGKYKSAFGAQWRLITTEEVPDHIGSVGKADRRVAIGQYSLSDELIAQFDSLKNAVAVTGKSATYITARCNGKSQPKDEFVFNYIE